MADLKAFAEQLANLTVKEVYALSDIMEGYSKPAADASAAAPAADAPAA